MMKQKLPKHLLKQVIDFAQFAKREIIVIGSGFVLVLIFSFGSCHGGIVSGLEKGSDLLYRKQYVAADQLYRKLLKKIDSQNTPTQTEETQRLLILDRLGKINALYLHDYKQAITFYNILVRMYPETEEALAARSIIADLYEHKLGDLEAAIEEYRKLTSLPVDRVELKRAQLQIVSLYLRLKNYEQARIQAQTLIDRWPLSMEASQARFQLGNAYYVEGRYSEAIAAYEQLLQMNSDANLTALVLFELGNSFQGIDNFPQALEYYYASLAEHPNPKLVQRKIRRVRQRLHQVTPAPGIRVAQGVYAEPSGNAPLNENSSGKQVRKKREKMTTPKSTMTDTLAADTPEDREAVEIMSPTEITDPPDELK